MAAEGTVANVGKYPRVHEGDTSGDGQQAGRYDQIVMPNSGQGLVVYGPSVGGASLSSHGGTAAPLSPQWALLYGLARGLGVQQLT